MLLGQMLYRNDQILASASAMTRRNVHQHTALPLRRHQTGV